MLMGDGSAQDCFIWEDQAWTMTTNSGNSGEKSGQCKLPGSGTSDCQLPPTGRKRPRASESNGDGGRGKGIEAKSGGGGGAESDHEVHIWTERERRKKMRSMFSNLHALLPQLPPKADKSTIVDEAVNYIKTLQQTLQKLQNRKLEILHGFNCGNPSPSIFGSQKLNAELTTREAFLADHHQGSSGGGLASFIGSSSAADALLPPQPPAFQTWTSPNVILNVCGDDAQISLCCPKKPGLFPAICFVLEKHKIEVVSAQVSSDHHRTMYMVQARANRPPCDDLFSEMSVSVEEVYKQAAGEIMLWIANQY
ncbi:PREDICTED: transcription factor bHLH95-like [Ipomoea nil]|uniref:transcription factor bHLH95-like n=1 Tax=Ipomoea nil TaxID=35883 RepID=UPI0009013333|nr:PREDICTED: transcription factor bHLH95-like [Ipomoea nil]